MYEWKEFSKELPEFEKEVLIYFAELDHAENATVYQGENDSWYYVLFDGESLNKEATHWTYFNKP